MNDLVRTERALLSTWDKTGLEPFARSLEQVGVQLLASGGTASVLAAAGISVAEIGTLTGRGAAFGGRLKTLSFEVAAALLFDRERDAEEARAEGVVAVDLVLVNLYPFAERARAGASLDELVELIDIGGPTMIRAAAKNHRYVTVVTDPADYDDVRQEIEQLGGTSLALRRRLAQKAFARTAAYEMAIAERFAAEEHVPAFYEARTRVAPLRYGENPHQAARIFLRDREALVFEQRGGKELSFNNYVDLQAALDAVVDLPRPAVAIVKHENPCGLAMADDALTALTLAWAGDPVSAFGSVIASNRPLTRADVAFLQLDDARKEARKFVEIVAAPGFSAEALDYLAQHRSLRTLIVEPASGLAAVERRYVRGLLLEQAKDRALDEPLTVVTKGAAGGDAAGGEGGLDEELIRFGLLAARQLKSNAIALVKRSRPDALHLVGMGAGQPNRRASTELALATARANGITDFAPIVLVSDAFFPFADGVETALAAGIRIVIEPGGSLRDNEIKAACEASGATLVFTGRRHFRH